MSIVKRATATLAAIITALLMIGLTALLILTDILGTPGMEGIVSGVRDWMTRPAEAVQQSTKHSVFREMKTFSQGYRVYVKDNYRSYQDYPGNRQDATCFIQKSSGGQAAAFMTIASVFGDGEPRYPAIDAASAQTFGLTPAEVTRLAKEHCVF